MGGGQVCKQCHQLRPHRVLANGVSIKLRQHLFNEIALAFEHGDDIADGVGGGIGGADARAAGGGTFAIAVVVTMVFGFF